MGTQAIICNEHYVSDYPRSDTLSEKENFIWYTFRLISDIADIFLPVSTYACHVLYYDSSQFHLQ